MGLHWHADPPCSGWELVSERCAPADVDLPMEHGSSYIRNGGVVRVSLARMTKGKEPY